MRSDFSLALIAASAFSPAGPSFLSSPSPSLLPSPVPSPSPAPAPSPSPSPSPVPSPSPLPSPSPSAWCCCSGCRFHRGAVERSDSAAN
ncbi:hypothetical protein CH296_28080 [Rhodococcus sp. 14-2496-1d]|nr:hypothetical protein CH296_28080 [Rhodococcus sp. 14-2496-1d]